MSKICCIQVVLLLILPVLETVLRENVQGMLKDWAAEDAGERYLTAAIGQLYLHQNIYIQGSSMFTYVNNTIKQKTLNSDFWNTKHWEDEEILLVPVFRHNLPKFLMLSKRKYIISKRTCVSTVLAELTLLVTMGSISVGSLCANIIKSAFSVRILWNLRRIKRAEVNSSNAREGSSALGRPLIREVWIWR